MADLAGNDLQPHIHFLSQIYRVRHLEGQWRNGHCIFYEGWEAKLSELIMWMREF